MRAKEGDVVLVHYVGRFKDGTVFDSSKGREPLKFIIGSGQVIRGFENAVIGMKPNQKKTVNIPAKNAYGPLREDLVAEVSRDTTPEGLELEVGKKIGISGPDGRVMGVTVVEVTDTTVKVDANHPMAGKDLIFEITLKEIQ
ncbi:MAG: FKBP-type peptidyl-prolyl cis-trans isomerase [Candidatus Omnitrophica bacterium]|nr:FKBP-type peptidyl-prolyl cis-trans isomerase [Candidatus Omnitrophota bacterium]